jgi:O-glycosyl hydrolase
MNRFLVAFACTVILLAVPTRAQQAPSSDFKVLADAHGGISEILVDGEDVPLRMELRVPAKGWSRNGRLNPAKPAVVSTRGDLRHWQGTIELEKGKVCRYEMGLLQGTRSVTLDVNVVAEVDLDVEGVYLWTQLPISLFLGGKASLTSEGGAQTTVDCPTTLPDKYIFLSGQAKVARIADAANRTAVEFQFDRVINSMLQDDRKFSGSDYSFMFKLAAGPLKAGQQTAVRVTIVPAATADSRPANLGIDVTKVRYTLDGFGGNYCFAIDSAPAQYTLENLQSAWARIEMIAARWAPDPTDFATSEPDWTKLESRDTPGSDLRRRFEFDQQLHKRSLPLVASIWWLPEWLYGDGGSKNSDGHRRIVPRDKWPKLAAVVGSYLLHEKRRYGVEPDLFSFNESNAGVMVLMTPEEHRDVIKFLGAHFDKLGLKTKMLLGDSTGAGSIRFTSAAAADPDALKYVGAVAFHSWGGADAATYAAWADLADRLKRPLLVTELGVDADYNSRPHQRPGYGLREVRMYQELLLHARPAGTMYWEFTSDYSLVDYEKKPDGKSKIFPTDRFLFAKHFCNLTPPHAKAFATSSDHPKVLVTAFAAGTDPQRVYTVHIANLGPKRDVHLTGLPNGVKRFRAICTGDSDSFREIEPVSSEATEAHVTIPARSLLTLTNLPKE